MRYLLLLVALITSTAFATLYAFESEATGILGCIESDFKNFVSFL